MKRKSIKAWSSQRRAWKGQKPREGIKSLNAIGRSWKMLKMLVWWVMKMAQNILFSEWKKKELYNFGKEMGCLEVGGTTDRLCPCHPSPMSDVFSPRHAGCASPAPLRQQPIIPPRSELWVVLPTRRLLTSPFFTSEHWPIHYFHYFSLFQFLSIFVLPMLLRPLLFILFFHFSSSSFFLSFSPPNPSRFSPLPSISLIMIVIWYAFSVLRTNQ